MMMTDTMTLTVWKIHDGEDHWVTASTAENAIATFLAEYGWTAESYPIETGESLADLVVSLETRATLLWHDDEDPTIKTLADAINADPSVLVTPTLLGSSCY